MRSTKTKIGNEINKIETKKQASLLQTKARTNWRFS